MNVADAAVVELLRKSGQEVESEICGASMSPTLAAGTRIRIRYGAVSYQPGDIVAILAEPQIAHRIVSVERRGGRCYLLTRGDGLWYCDPPVADDQILGTVTAQYDAGGWRPIGPCPPAGWSAIPRWLSEHAIRTALTFSEAAAVRLARGVTRLALLGRRRG